MSHPVQEETTAPLRSRLITQAGLALASGALLALPYWIEAWGVLVIPGLACWAVAVDPRLFRRWAWAGYGATFLYVYLGLFWLNGFYPLAPLLLGLYFALYGLLAAWCHRRLVGAGTPAWLALPLVWVSGEYLLRIASIFPTAWLNAGYALLPLDRVAQSADLWGVGGLGFLACLAGGLLAECAHLVSVRSRSAFLRIAVGGITLTAFVSAAVWYGDWRVRTLPAGREIEVLLVQGNIPQAVKQNPMEETAIRERYFSLTREGAGPGLDLIVWPETAAFARPRPGETASWQQGLTRLSDELDTPLIAGGFGLARDSSGEHTTNSAFLYEPGRGLTGRYDKLLLVPFGEYVPFIRFLPAELQRTIQESVREWVGTFPYTIPGPGPRVLQVGEGEASFGAGALICYEDVMPGLTASFVRRGADLLVNPSNEAWYLPREMDQHVMIARMRAIENRRSMVRATNTGLTVVIDPLGRETARLRVDGRDRDVAGSLRTGAVLCPVLTLYSRCGPLFSQACLAVMLVLLLASIVRGAPRRTTEETGPPDGGNHGLAETVAPID